MAVKDNNGLIYGIGKLKFNNKEIGWISQEGLSPKGELQVLERVQDGAAQPQSRRNNTPRSERRAK